MIVSCGTKQYLRYDSGHVLAPLVLPLALLVQWVHCQKNICVGIVAVCIVNDSVGAHAIR